MRVMFLQAEPVLVWSRRGSGTLWEVMWDVAGPQKDPTLGTGLQGSSSRAVAGASQVCPRAVSVPCPCSQGQHLTYSFSASFIAEKRMGLGREQNARHARSHLQVRLLGEGTEVCVALLSPLPNHTSTVLGTGEPPPPSKGSSWSFLKPPALLLLLLPKSQEQGVSVPGRPNWSQRGPQPCWGGGGRHLGSVS